jgi:hypothetical protein
MVKIWTDAAEAGILERIEDAIVVENDDSVHSSAILQPWVHWLTLQC